MRGSTSAARAMLCPVEEVNFLSGPGRGVILIKIDFPEDKVIGALISGRTDPELFALSYDYVGDLSETIALMWPAPREAGAANG